MRPLRDRTPNKLHIISCRTRLSELLFIPSSKINNCIGGVIAKYANKLEVKLYAVAILGNHYHILLESKNVSLFAEQINREIAKRINKLLNRESSLWSRRFDDLITLEAEDELEALLYILTNPVKHGLVIHPKHWPGIITYNQSINGKTEEYSFFEYTKYNKAIQRAKLTGEVVHRSDFEKRYELKIETLNIFKNLNKNEVYKKLNKLIESRTRKLCEERRKQGKSFLGRKNVLNQSRSFPTNTNKSKRPKCYTRSIRALIQYSNEFKERIAQYKEASIKYRLGHQDYEFPPYCFLPPRHHIPKPSYFAYS